MKSEKDIRIKIARIKEENEHLLMGSMATVDINAPRAIGQLAVTMALVALHWVIEETYKHEYTKKRPNT